MNAALAKFNFTGKKNSLSREQAMGIYDDLKTNFTKYETVAQQKARMNPTAKKQAYTAYSSKEDVQPDPIIKNGPSKMTHSTLVQGGGERVSGMWSAFMVVGFFAVAKICISFLEYSGTFKVETASASMSPTMATMPAALPFAQQPFSPEKMQLLTALDTRRSEIEGRSKKLDTREDDMKKQEQDLIARTQELRELTAALRNDRDKNDKRKDGQLEQLANVYGAMDPVEAAKLIQQLDVTIALGLLKRMPEKRIGQILSLMQPERALTITKMLSGSV